MPERYLSVPAADLTKGAARGLPPSAFVIWSREKRSRPPNRETRVACWSSTLTAGFVSALALAGFGFAAFVSVFVRVARPACSRASRS